MIFMNDRDPAYPIVADQKTEQCFYCGRELHFPLIYWQGECVIHDPQDALRAVMSATGKHIFMHPSCTVELVIRLIRDVHEYELQSKEMITDAPDVM